MLLHDKMATSGWLTKCRDNVAKLRYFGRAATNQNCRPKDIIKPATTVFLFAI